MSFIFFRYYYVRAKILKAEIQFAACYPHTVPSGILTILNNCLIESQTSQLDFQSALIHLQIANCMLLIGLTSRALSILDKCLIQILGHGGCHDRARAMLLYVKCTVADSHKLEESKRKEVILSCAKLLNKVKENFKNVEAYSRMKDVLYLQVCELIVSCLFFTVQKCLEILIPNFFNCQIICQHI